MNELRDKIRDLFGRAGLPDPSEDETSAQLLEELLAIHTEQIGRKLRTVAKELLGLEREYVSGENIFDSGWNHGIWVAIDTIGEHLGEDEYAYLLAHRQEGDKAQNE